MEAVADTTSTTLVPSAVAATLVGAFQVLVTWFILGNQEVLMQTTPVTIAAITTAEAFGLVRWGDRLTIAFTRAAGSVALIALAGFCFVAAIGSSRGHDPIGQPPMYTEWAITLAIVFMVFVTAGYTSRSVR